MGKSMPNFFACIWRIQAVCRMGPRWVQFCSNFPCREGHFGILVVTESADLVFIMSGLAAEGQSQYLKA